MADENQELYRVSLMRTLWENTYSGTVFDCTDRYIARIRLILGIPLDRSIVPENAPEAQPFITVLVEDTILTPKDVLDFEAVVSRIISRKASSDTFKPTSCMFFYPSPAEIFEEAEKTQNQPQTIN